MGLTSTKQSVAERYRAKAQQRIDAQVNARLDRIELASRFIMSALDFTVTDHFEKAEQAAQNPYPSGNRASIAVMTPESFASGNDVETEGAVKALDPREQQEIVKRVQQELKGAGFESQVSFAPEKLTMTLLVWDPHFAPIAEDQLARSRFNEELKKV